MIKDRHYAAELGAFISKQEHGCFLDAGQASGLGTLGTRAAFRLPSGRLQRQYVWIAGLFRNTSVFETCIEKLAQLVTDEFGYGAPPYSVLAACTANAHFLASRLHARLLHNQPALSYEYFGPYPLQHQAARSESKRRDVIIVADVVASGSLCRDLANEVERAIGSVRGIVTVAEVLDGPVVNAMIDDGVEDFELSDGRRVPLRALCCFSIPSVNPEKVDEGEIEDITTSTVLRRIIADPANGMLLNARRHDEQNAPSGELAIDPVFELTSGVYQREFVTSWGIFDKPWYFENCMEQLTKMAVDIRRSNWFQVIVTCTATGRHIMDHLQSRIETVNDPVRVHNLGPFPYHGLRHRHINLENQRVLVVTDVIAKGRMVNNILAVVERLSGIPVAVMSVVGLVRDKNAKPTATISFGPVSDQEPNETLELDSGADDERREVPAFYLTSYYIPLVTTVPDRIYRIDPSTVLPVESFPRGGFRSIFGARKGLEHFDQAEALTVGFYGEESRLVMAAIHISRLLDGVGDEIWKEIEAQFADNCTLVTTFAREDLVFHSFIERKATGKLRNVQTVFLPRSESIDFDFPYFAPANVRERLRDRAVILILSSAHTSTKLRKLVAVLAQSEVRQVTVICLLNRMGARTAEFVSRIRKMIQGSGTDAVLNFRFVSVYEVRDLRGDPLRRTIETIQWLASQYVESTPEATYQALTQQEINRYFHVSALSGLRFDKKRPTPGSGSLALDREIWNHTSLDGKIYAMCCYVAQRRESGQPRDYRPLIDEVPGERQRHILYSIYAILLSDVSYLRLAGDFAALRQSLMDRVSQSRDHRLRIERESMAKPRISARSAKKLSEMLAEEVQVETYYLFGLALFCYMDEERHPYAPFIESVANGGFADPASWGLYPRNYSAYFGNERVLWCVSLLIYLTAPSARDRNGFHERLTALGRLHREFVKDFRPPNVRSKEWKETVNKIRYLWDAFVTHLGGHEAVFRHQVIRHLHLLLIEPRRNHLLVVTDPKHAEFKLTEFLRDQEKRYGVFPDEKPVSFSAPEFDSLKRALEDAIHSSAALEGVGDAIAKLFSFHSAGGGDPSRYVSGLKSRGGGFRSEVSELRRLFQTIRDSREVTRLQARRIGKLRAPIESELTLSNSDVLTSLKWYIVPLQAKLQSAMDQADAILAKEGFPYAWPKHSDSLNVPEFVLMDPTELKGVLVNLCTNIRHGLQRDEDPADQISISVRTGKTPAPSPEVGDIDIVTIVIESPLPEMFEEIPPNRTIRRQQLTVEQYGGRLSLEADREMRRFRAELELVSRTKTQRAWVDRFGEFATDPRD